MIFMNPYAAPQYFGIFAAAVLPAVILQSMGKRCNWYKVLLTIFFLYMSFGGPAARQGIALLAYVSFQSVLTSVYFAYRKKNNASPVFFAAVILSILPLFLLKLSGVLPNPKTFSVLGFLGISYLTFKAVQVVLEIRDGLITEWKPWRYIQFLLFFPTISAGPIDRFRRFEKDLTAPPEPERYLSLLSKGIENIFVGFLYNYIIGYLLGRIVLPAVENYVLNESGLIFGTLLYMYTYSLFLFFDFAGYSKLAIGVSNLLGYETPPNFNLPFLSTNIKDFWNRWHMSLSFWFRDYVYMRLLMTFLKKKTFRSRVAASNVAYFALFLLMGAWHGFTWYYIVYGLYHAALICAYDAWLRYKKGRNIPGNRLTKILSVVLTFHAVCFSFLIFSGFLEKY
ncbi:D-alanyl-lipoteichoic acid biosynthesis protein DltB [Clostridia bacterium]|nr:D-alanyl-lipoteichoic acid biosynthesis protein DltB [Clostridia bacterium]